uniref:Uncharacterized protein n=1 Tax=Angiostrongylus cantonensis TaxID=6313 RepID=A0A158PB06_ANGCA
MKYFDEHGHQEWLNFVVEASGVSDALKKIREMNAVDPSRRMDEQFRGDNGQPLYFTKENVTKMFGQTERRKIEVFEQLQRSLTPQQLVEQSQRGFSIMTDEQKELIYGRNSPYNSSETLKRLQFVNNSNGQALIEKEIRLIAENNNIITLYSLKVKNWKLRQRDVVASPMVLTSGLIASYPLLNQAVILSPLVLAPVILTPAVLGPVMLGPWLFVPIILAPRLLCPLSINPFLFSPIILSPLVLHPLVLSPGIFNPTILSPLVLSPFILSPQVFTPLILSPLLLNPIVLTPSLGTPLVLSPFLLSPLVLSPQWLFGVIFSPYGLSPVLASELNNATIIGSPSWLS